MPTPSFFPYRAFISYSHRDKAWCDWLHRGLERYRFSFDLVGRMTDAGPVPRDLRPVFRDRADFSAGPLQAQTIEALKSSQFLIVIASPDSAASAYVNEEIRLFKSFGGEDRVLSLIVAGEPPACFAPALRFRVAPDGTLTDAPADQIGADVAKDGKREALVKIIAKLVGLPYDILWQRDVKAHRARWVAYAAVGAIAIIAVIGFYTSFGLRHDVAEIGEKNEKAAQGRHEEIKEGQEGLARSLAKLQRSVEDATSGGAPAVKAIAEIRDLLRPGNPEIDTIPAEMLPKLVGRIIEDLQKPAARPEDFTGAVKRALQQAQAQTGELKFVDAAKTLDDAIAKAQAEDQNRAKGRSALLAERGRVAALQLRFREAAGFYAKAAEAAAFDPKLSWTYAVDAAIAIYAQGDEFGDNAALSESIQRYRSALNLAPRERVPLAWAATQDRLGVALIALGERESGTATLREGVSAYRAALQERTRARVPLQWATTRANLGWALFRLEERESGTAKLQEAVAAYREALQEQTRERVPHQRAATQERLGSALARLGERESGTATLQEAVRTFREALGELTRERVPLQWAATQHDLGAALWRLGEREKGTARLQEAAAAFREALKERTRERAPLQWAATQNGLGSALAMLGERESETATLQEAVGAYGEALKEQTRERVPLEWAATYGDQGEAMMRIAERTKDAAMAKSALAQINAAYETMQASGHALGAAYYGARLPEARTLLKRLVAGRRPVSAPAP